MSNLVFSLIVMLLSAVVIGTTGDGLALMQWLWLVALAMNAASAGAWLIRVRFVDRTPRSIRETRRAGLA